MRDINRRPRVLIADDHTLIAEAFHQLLVQEFDIVAIVHDGRRLMEAAQELRPDVILVDIGMPLLNGLQAAGSIKRLLPNVKLVYVTVNDDAELVAEAFRRGASAFLPKTSAGSELVTAIHTVLDGGTYVSSLLPTAVAHSGEAVADDRVETTRPDLTDRQLEVLQLLAEGKSMKEAASVLNLTTRTVAFHKYRLMQNLQLKNDAEVVQYALRRHIIFE
jgi:DNA-binding NarL/FixJ family response regulator